ncbi:hypothetical protein KY284_029742 [Solanum tuberosum]|nr:hypothetical protein KY284_029742 [Solanum tuberosum]
MVLKEEITPLSFTNMVFYAVYVHFAEEMYEMVSLTVQFLTQQHFLFEVSSIYWGEREGKREKERLAKTWLHNLLL